MAQAAPNRAVAPVPVSHVSLGCAKTLVDTERFLAALSGRYEVNAPLEKARAVVINTCGFIQSAKEQSINTILEMAELKKSGQLEMLVVVGCLVEQYRQDLKREIPEVDHLLNIAEEEKLGDLLDAHFGQAPPPMKRPSFAPRLLTTPRHFSYLKISEGCNQTCTFCSIPLMRGRQVSTAAPALIKEARWLQTQGVKELNLIAQDLTSYGRDVPGGWNLEKLLRRLLDETDIPWIRLLYNYPSFFTEGLMQLMAENPRLLPYVDMPLQHASEKILRAMKRPANVEATRQLLAQIRQTVPGVVLRTTFIVGFPGETEDDFQRLLDFLTEMEFDRVGAFTFSREENTPSGSMKAQVSASRRQERYERLMAHQQPIAARAARRFKGRQFTFLVDHIEGGMAQARFYGQAHEIDGDTWISLKQRPAVKEGDFVTATVTKADAYDLMARLG